jgi:hypothetical protein
MIEYLIKGNNKGFTSVVFLFVVSNDPGLVLLQPLLVVFLLEDILVCFQLLLSLELFSSFPFAERSSNVIGLSLLLSGLGFGALLEQV